MKGRPSEELTERNQKIFEDYDSGKLSTAQLAIKYDLTRQRVWKIINRHQKKLKELLKSD